MSWTWGWERCGVTSGTSVGVGRGGLELVYSLPTNHSGPKSTQQQIEIHFWKYKRPFPVCDVTHVWLLATPLAHHYTILTILTTPDTSQLTRDSEARQWNQDPSHLCNLEWLYIRLGAESLSKNYIRRECTADAINPIPHLIARGTWIFHRCVGDQWFLQTGPENRPPELRLRVSWSTVKESIDFKSRKSFIFQKRPVILKTLNTYTLEVSDFCRVDQETHCLINIT